jgi:hypothetical protein
MQAGSDNSLGILGLHGSDKARGVCKTRQDQIISLGILGPRI